MKTLLTLAFVTLSTFSFAADSPDFICEEQSGFTYEFYMSNYHEIHQYDENGQFLGMYDGITVDFKSVETFPSIDQFAFRYADEGRNEIAVIEFQGNEDVGSGEMIDHDQTMTCIR